MRTKNELTALSIKPKVLQVHPHLRTYTGYCFYKLALRIRSLIDQELQPFGIVAPQFAVLSMLKNLGSKTQVELGNCMSIDKATMVRLIDGLEKLGYLTRGQQAGDRRAKVLAITKAGEKIFNKLSQARQKAEQQFLAPLSKTEQSQLNAILQKMIV